MAAAAAAERMDSTALRRRNGRRLSRCVARSTLLVGCFAQRLDVDYANVCVSAPTHLHRCEWTRAGLPVGGGRPIERRSEGSVAAAAPRALDAPPAAVSGRSRPPPDCICAVAAVAAAAAAAGAMAMAVAAAAALNENRHRRNLRRLYRCRAAAAFASRAPQTQRQACNPMETLRL